MKRAHESTVEKKEVEKKADEDFVFKDEEDDETTIEKADNGYEEGEDELEILKKEAEIPIEELRRRIQAAREEEEDEDDEDDDDEDDEDYEEDDDEDDEEEEDEEEDEEEKK